MLNETIVEEVLNIDDLKIHYSLKKYFKNCIKKDSFSNMLFYGNPGTGKTTTTNVIIKTYINNKTSNIVYDYEDDITKVKQELNKNILILNASVYRNTYEFLKTILNFYNSKNMFHVSNYKKFVILDEIDYMTQQGQKCLINLIKKCNNIVFICMCNYLNKLIPDIKNYFLIFNYNCFGDLVKNHIIDSKDDSKNNIELLNYILVESDIREYKNEKNRINIIGDNVIDKIIKLLNEHKKHIMLLIDKNDIYEMTNFLNNINNFTNYTELSGISEEKIRSLLIQSIVNDYINMNKNDLNDYYIKLIETYYLENIK